MPTSVCHVELDSKVSTRASGAVTGCEDDPTYGFDLPDDAGDSRGGQEAVVSDNQPSDLSTEEKNNNSMDVKTVRIEMIPVDLVVNQD